jgi:hypothetical protein
MKYSSSIAAVLLIMTLTGCSSMEKTFENRVACTADGKQLLVASLYGPIGVASKISPDDAAVICGKKE